MNSKTLIRKSHPLFLVSIVTLVLSLMILLYHEFALIKNQNLYRSGKLLFWFSVLLTTLGGYINGLNFIELKENQDKFYKQNEKLLDSISLNI